MNNFSINMLAAKAQKGPRELRQDELQQLHDALLVEVNKHGYKNIADFIKIDLLSTNPEQEVFDAQLRLQEECKDWALKVDELENTIFIESANRHEVVESMEQLLNKRRNLGIFQRMGKMVRILKEHSKSQSRTGQEIRIDELDKHALMLAFDEIAFFEVYKADSGVIKRVNTNEKHVSLLLSKKQWDLPVLKGIIHAPTLRIDGSPLDEEGYDEKSELFFISNGWKFGKIPKNPTRQDALAALQKLTKVFETFPFEDKLDLSVVISAVLTGFIRMSLDSAPIIGITAPTMSTGKSLLSETIATIIDGYPCSAIQRAATVFEEQKRLLPLLARSGCVVSFDNVDEDFGNSSLCSAITQGYIEERKLCTNELVKVPTNKLFLVNGNNLKFTGDISKRALLVRLDTYLERPENKGPQEDPRQYVTDHRAELVIAVLTILHAYDEAGRPMDQEQMVGSRFAAWSKRVRGAVIWLDMKDPCLSCKAVEAEDPVTITLRNLLVTWHKLFGSMSITIKRLTDEANTTPQAASADEIATRESLKDALLELSGSNQEKINLRALGKKISTLKKRICSGYRLEQFGEQQGSALWRVVVVKENGK